MISSGAETPSVQLFDGCYVVLRVLRCTGLNFAVSDKCNSKSPVEPDDTDDKGFVSWFSSLFYDDDQCAPQPAAGPEPLPEPKLEAQTEPAKPSKKVLVQAWTEYDANNCTHNREMIQRTTSCLVSCAASDTIDTRGHCKGNGTRAVEQLHSVHWKPCDVRELRFPVQGVYGLRLPRAIHVELIMHDSSCANAAEGDDRTKEAQMHLGTSRIVVAGHEHIIQLCGTPRISAAKSIWVPLAAASDTSIIASGKHAMPWLEVELLLCTSMCSCSARFSSGENGRGLNSDGSQEKIWLPFLADSMPLSCLGTHISAIPRVKPLRSIRRASLMQIKVEALAAAAAAAAASAAAGQAWLAWAAAVRTIDAISSWQHCQRRSGECAARRGCLLHHRLRAPGYMSPEQWPADQRSAAQQAMGCDCDRRAHDTDYSKTVLHQVTKDDEITHEYNLSSKLQKPTAKQHEADLSPWQRFSLAVSEAIDDSLKAAAEAIVQQADGATKNTCDDSRCTSDNQSKSDAQDVHIFDENDQNTALEIGTHAMRHCRYRTTSAARRLWRKRRRFSGKSRLQQAQDAAELETRLQGGSESSDEDNRCTSSSSSDTEAAFTPSTPPSNSSERIRSINVVTPDISDIDKADLQALKSSSTAQSNTVAQFLLAREDIHRHSPANAMQQSDRTNTHQQRQSVADILLAPLGFGGNPSPKQQRHAISVSTPRRLTFFAEGIVDRSSESTTSTCADVHTALRRKSTVQKRSDWGLFFFEKLTAREHKASDENLVKNDKKHWRCRRQTEKYPEGHSALSKLALSANSSVARFRRGSADQCYDPRCKPKHIAIRRLQQDLWADTTSNSRAETNACENNVDMPTPPEEPGMNALSAGQGCQDLVNTGASAFEDTKSAAFYGTKSSDVQRKMSDISVASSRDSITSVLSELSEASRYSTSEDEANGPDNEHAQDESQVSWTSPTRWVDWVFGSSTSAPASTPITESKSVERMDVPKGDNPAVGDSGNDRCDDPRSKGQHQCIGGLSPEQSLSLQRRCSRVNVWMPNNTFEQSPAKQ